jgi:hypothetical protein
MSGASDIPDELYALTEQDRDAIRDHANRLRKMPHAKRVPGPQDIVRDAPEVYVVVPPCGVGIPGREGAVLGSSECCLFRATPVDPEDLDTDWELAPIVDPDGHQHKVLVFHSLPHGRRYTHPTKFM